MQKIDDMIMDKKAMDWVAKGEDMFKSVPHLPVGVVEFLVKIAPYMAIIGAILGVIGGPFMALASVLSLITFNPLVVLSMVAATVFVVLNVILLFMAFKPLQNREMRGWLLLFWSEVLGVVSTLVGILGGGNIVGGLVGAIIGFYILYEMKPAYNGRGKTK